MLKAAITVSAFGLLLGACSGNEEPVAQAPEQVAQAPSTAAAQPASEQGGWTQPSPDGKPSLSADSPIDVGRYIAVVALCNDCHTPGWLPNGDVPENLWLSGNPVGYEGPWGVTFPSNLRLRAQEWTEDQWVQTLRTREALEPMPWIAVNHMSEKDARALYRFLRYLGPIGEAMPPPIPPGSPITQQYTSLRVWEPHTTLQAVPDEQGAGAAESNESD